MDTIGFLMMSHMIEPEQLAEQALLMESYGATTIYCTDSGGAMNMDDYAARLQAYDRVLKPETALTARHCLLAMQAFTQASFAMLKKLLKTMTWTRAKFSALDLKKTKA